jgi:transcriptional regulator with XRE-family HTH domain
LWASVSFTYVPRTLQNHLKRGYGNRLKKSRVRVGLSQRALSFPGCTAAYISRIETNARCPSMQMIYELAARLDVDPHWLATGETASTHSDLRRQLQAARARIRHLESKLKAVAQIIRD